MKSGLLSAIKSKLVADGSRERAIAFGLYRGIRCDVNFKSQTQLFLGLWERETYDAIRRAAARAAWFMDVGAGRGELVVYFARLERVRRIVAIEPSGDDVEALKRTLGYNGIGEAKVEIIGRYAGTGGGENSVQLDDVGLAQSEPGFIKIDVDGFELDVLQSGRSLLSQGKVDLLIETHSAELEQGCIRFLESLGYDCRIIRNAWWRALLPEHRPIEHNRWFFAAKPVR